ncbi:hypothetical protein O181_006796 [Austropuccinia psidii MF-1]|uniref:PCI domain-containing protein n=1 Tax=Austropuccinia psidii MF-1 TaxID=1389203 RepID=A0A9Q3GH26_9BASI|nr:hypothetical protein [Austropuccinia psidii MF-1]
MPTLKPSKYAEESVLPSIEGRYGEALADCFSIKDSHCKSLFQSCNTTPTTAENLIKRKLIHHNPWGNLAATHFRVVFTLFDTQSSPDYLALFDAQRSLVSSYNDWFRSDDTTWALSVLFVICRDLRYFATCADKALLLKGEKTSRLAEAARLIQVGFGLCCSDRSSTGETKKSGVLFMAGLLFKIYFQLKSTALCKNVTRGVENAGLLDGFNIPISHRVTYRYYMGVLSFLQEEYDMAEQHLDYAFRNCHRDQQRNRSLILNYLIPLKLLKGKRPVSALLDHYTKLSQLYETFISAVELGNVEMFDQHMARVEKQLMERGTYLVVERCRDVCLCNFVKLIHRLKLNTYQIPLQAFRKLVYELEDSTDSGDSDSMLDEVECLLANLIAQDRVRGYIHHQAKMLVLSKKDAFPIQTIIKAY